jgi:hypothetical protein
MDKLKRQLLGKSATMPKAEPAKKKPSQPVAPAVDGLLNDDDSDEGRVGAISSKSAAKAKLRNPGLKSRSAEEEKSSDENNRFPISTTTGPKRHSSFLDEVLSTKKKRKKQS